MYHKKNNETVSYVGSNFENQCDEQRQEANMISLLQGLIEGSGKNHPIEQHTTN